MEMLDGDLAELYGVETRALVQALKRKLDRFPEDLMFQLTTEENERLQHLRSQIVISSSGHGGRRYPPYAFTEQGVAMLSSILRSPQAIAVNIEIMRAFVRLRQVLATNPGTRSEARCLGEETHYARPSDHRTRQRDSAIVRTTANQKARHWLCARWRVNVGV